MHYMYSITVGTSLYVLMAQKVLREPNVVSYVINILCNISLLSQVALYVMLGRINLGFSGWQSNFLGTVTVS